MKPSSCFSILPYTKPRVQHIILKSQAFHIQEHHSRSHTNQPKVMIQKWCKELVQKSINYNNISAKCITYFSDAQLLKFIISIIELMHNCFVLSIIEFAVADKVQPDPPYFGSLEFNCFVLSIKYGNKTLKRFILLDSKTKKNENR